MANTVISQVEYEKMVQENKKRILNEFADSDEPAKHLTNDLVNHPNHYTFGSIEVIDYIRDKMTPDEFQGYCMGNILKYVSRHKHKNGVEDLKKAQVYLGWLIESESKNEPDAPIDGDFDGDHTDKHLACSAYDFRPSVRFRKNSNADNEKDGV